MGQNKPGPAGLQKLLSLIDVSFAHVTAYVLPYVELLGGLAILVGIVVSIVSLPLIAIMAVSMFTIHIRFGFSSVNTIGLTPQGPLFGPPGYEISLIYIAGLIALIILGAGAFSVGALMACKKVSHKRFRQSTQTKETV